MQLQNGKVIVTDSNISKILVSGSVYFTNSPADTRIGFYARVDGNSTFNYQLLSSMYNTKTGVNDSMGYLHIKLSPRYFIVHQNSLIGISVIAMKNGSILAINSTPAGTFLTIEVIE